MLFVVVWRRLESVLLGLLCVVCLGSAQSCTSAPSPLARIINAHNAVASSRETILGPVLEGSLTEGTQQSISLALAARCYTISAFGGDGARSLSLALSSASGAIVAAVASPGAAPSLRYCADHAGSYTLTVRMVRGSGSFALASWSSLRANDGASRRASDGTCRAPHPIALGETVSGTTIDAPSTHRSWCHSQGEVPVTPDVVYQVDVPQRSLVRATVRAAWPALLSLRSECDEPESEQTCAALDDSGRAEISSVVEAGRYWLIVDGEQPAGDFTLEVNNAPAPSAAAICEEAPLLQSGTPLAQTLLGRSDRGSPSCGARRSAPDSIYRIDLAERSRVAVRIAHPSFFGSVALRRGCSNSGEDELECASFFVGAPFAALSATLDPGRYSVIVDSSRPSSPATFAIRADVVALARVGATQGDRCTDAIALPLNGSISGDTIAMADDVAAPCGPRTGGLDQVFSLDLTQPMLVRIELVGRSTGWTLFVVDHCAESPAQACSSSSRRSWQSLTTVLQPGRHFVVAEASRPGVFGEFMLRVDSWPAAPAVRACTNPPTLPHNTSVRGTTARASALPLSCVSDASAAAVYRLVLERRSTVTLSATPSRAAATPEQGLAIELRRDCLDQSRSLACDLPGGRTAALDARLDPGTYWVIVATRTPDSDAVPFTLRSVVDGT